MKIEAGKTYTTPHFVNVYVVGFDVDEDDSPYVVWRDAHNKESVDYHVTVVGHAERTWAELPPPFPFKVGKTYRKWGATTFEGARYRVIAIDVINGGKTAVSVMSYQDDESIALLHIEDDMEEVTES